MLKLLALILPGTSAGTELFLIVVVFLVILAPRFSVDPWFMKPSTVNCMLLVDWLSNLSVLSLMG